MSEVIMFKHPVIEAFKQAVSANWGFSPRVVRRSEGFVVQGMRMESRPYSEAEMTRITWAIANGCGRKAV